MVDHEVLEFEALHLQEQTKQAAEHAVTLRQLAREAELAAAQLTDAANCILEHIAGTDET